MEQQGNIVTITEPTAAPTTSKLTPADGKAFMDIILYGETAGWDKPDRPSSAALVAGHKKLMQDVLVSRENAAGGQTTADGSGSAAEPQEGQVVIAAPGIEDEGVKGVLAEAKRICEAAEATLSNGLISCENWMGLRDDFYHAGALFSLAGLPDDAARCLLQATYINRAFKDDDEALSSLTLSVNQIKLAHPSIAVESLVRLAACYERNNLTLQAARCLKEAAEIYDGRLDEKDNAIEQYTAAIDLYHRAQNPYRMERSLVDQCHERLCFLHTVLGHYEISEQLFLEKARSIPRNLPATRFYMYATLAVLARGHDGEDAYFDSIYDARKTFDRLQEADLGYQKGKENELMRALLKANEENSLNQFDLAVQTYKEYKTTLQNTAFDLLTERCRQNLFEHLERFA